MVVVFIVKDCFTKEKNKENFPLHTIPCCIRSEEMEETSEKKEI